MNYRIPEASTCSTAGVDCQVDCSCNPGISKASHSQPHRERSLLSDGNDSFFEKTARLLKKRALICTFFLLLALFLNFHKFTKLPPSYALGFEEIETGVNAYRALSKFYLPRQSPINLLKVCDYIPVPCSHLFTNLLPFFSFLLFGESVLSLRLPFVILGSLTIPIFFLFLTELVAPLIAVVGALLLVTARWHIFGARIADELFSGIFWEITLLLFFVKSIKYNQKKDFFLTGLFLGLITYEYVGYRAALIFIPCALIYHSFRQIVQGNLVLNQLLRISIFFVTFLIIVSPLLYNLASGDDIIVEGFRRHFNDRLGGGYRSLSSIIKNNLGQVLPDKKIVIQRCSQTIAVFSSERAGIEEFGSQLPLFDLATRFLFAFALLYILLTIKKPRHFFFLSWFVMTIGIAAFLPVNFYPGRFMSVLPFVYLFISFLLNSILFRIKSKQHLRACFVASILFVVITSVLLNLKTLYFEQPKSSSVLGIFSAKRTHELCVKEKECGWIWKSLK